MRYRLLETVRSLAHQGSASPTACAGDMALTTTKTTRTDEQSVDMPHEHPQWNVPWVQIRAQRGFPRRHEWQ